MRTLLSGLCLALALLLGAVPAARAELTVCSAGCDKSNVIDSDRTWKAATYRVQEHIQVRPGVTLTLEPGVRLLFTTHEMGLQVAGTLIARGTGDEEGQRITFTSDKAAPAPEDWGTLLFTETAVGASFDEKGSYISGSLFEHCVVEYAGGGAAQGAIWAQSRRAPYVYHSTIRNNGVSGMRLVGPPKAGGGNEGVQETRIDESTISGNSISSCSGEICKGGGIYVSSLGTATLSGNTLSGNSAGNLGGGIYLSSSGTATLSGNTLSGNSGASGGGIYLSSSGTAKLSGNTLSANTLWGGNIYTDGGGIYLSSSGTATLSGNTLSGNSAGPGGGGGIALSSSGTAKLLGNMLLANISYSSGGGIALSSSGTAMLSGNTLLGNSAYYRGGGVYVAYSSSGTATLSGNTLSGNSAGTSGASGYGGGIYLSVSSDTATLSGNTLSGNSAGTSSTSGYGGGIYVFIDSSSSGTATLQENQILDNTASRTEGGGAGGGIHIAQGQPTLRRNDLIGNTLRQLWDGNAAPNPASPPHLDARYHWWGTTDEAGIGQGIWDWTDDLGLEVVDWRPDLTVPVFPFSSNLPPAPPAGPSPGWGDSSVARNPTLSWSASADPGDTVSYDVYLGTATDPPRVSQGQSATSYTPSALLERNTGYYWRVVARDSWGEESSGPRWSFTTGSSPGPILDPIGNQTVGEGQTLSFTISGSDPDRKPLTFSADHLPLGARFDPATRAFSWTPTFDQEGSYPAVRFSVSNGTYTASQEITLTVTHTNAPPSLDPIGNQQVNEGEVLSFTLSAGDPDGAGGLTFSADHLPPGASFDPAARRFSWTPTYDQAGTYTGVRFTVSDGSLTDSQAIEIRVVNVNRLPILAPVGNQEVNESQALSFTITGADPDGDFLLFSASNLPVGASFDPAARRFSWTPTFTQAGTYPGVRFSVSDGGFNDSEEITFTVHNVNAPPTANAQVATTAEDAPAAITLTGSDLDGDPLTFTVVTQPAHGTLSGTAPNLTYTPAADFNGSDSFTFRVSDGAAESAPAAVTLTITPVNDVPVLAPIGEKSISEGQLLIFTLSASDVEGDPLTYSASNLPSGANFNPSTRTFSWTPTFTQAGSYPNVQFQVSDGSLSDSKTITMTVNNVNRAPTANAQSVTTNKDTPASITLTGSDPDNDPLTFTVLSQPSHGTLTGTAPNLTYTPAANYNGSDSFTFKVNDGTIDSAPATVSLTVTAVNDAPVLNPIGNKNINEGQLLTFTIAGSDVDGDTLTYSASNLPPGASFDPATRTFSWTPTYAQASTYPNIRFEVSDGSLTDSDEITIRVISSAEAAYQYLYQVMDRYQTGDTPRLLESYTPTPTFDSQENVAHLYDSVLALQAFLARGAPEDLARARAIAEAFVTLQQRDPMGDGRLRDACAADSLLDESGVARLQLASTHTGNLAWAILGLLRYHQVQGGEKYREAAVKIGEWIVQNTLDTRGAGGFTGGVDETLQPIGWKSTEHHLDLYAALMRLYEATQERRWLGRAAQARGFLEAMWDTGEAHFWTGTLEDGVTINREPIPLDVQAWGVLALGKGYAGGLDWTQQALRLEPCECGQLKGYRFSTGGGGCWFEGTAHLALAQRIAGERTEAEGLLEELREVQASAPNHDGGGIVAACSDGVETGYGWSYFNSLHVGATAWYLLAERGVNPLEDPEAPIGPSVSGTILDSKKLPVSGVRVEAREADGTLVGVGITDAQGSYRLALPAGPYILTPAKETHLFAPASRKLTVKAKDLGKMNFTVKLLTLSGTVKDKKGKPFAGVTLRLRLGETTVTTAVTDAKGKYSFSLRNPGTYTVEPSRPGSRFDPESMEVTLTNGNRGGVNFKEVP